MNRDDHWHRKEPGFDGTPTVVPFRRPVASRQDKLWMVLTWVSLAFLLYKGSVWLETWHAGRSVKGQSQPDQMVDGAPQTPASTPIRRSPPARVEPTLTPKFALPSTNSPGKRSVTKCVLGGSVSFTDGDCPQGATRSAVSVDVSNVGTVAPVVIPVESLIPAQGSQNNLGQSQRETAVARAPSKSQSKAAECPLLKLRIEQIDAATRQLLTIQQQDMYREERRKVRQRETDLGC